MADEKVEMKDAMKVVWWAVTLVVSKEDEMVGQKVVVSVAWLVNPKVVVKVAMMVETLVGCVEFNYRYPQQTS